MLVRVFQVRSDERDHVLKMLNKTRIRCEKTLNGTHYLCRTTSRICDPYTAVLWMRYVVYMIVTFSSPMTVCSAVLLPLMRSYVCCIGDI
jgi:hypothetical protein